MLGLPKNEVLLKPWTAEWEEAYIKETEKIQDKIGNNMAAIYHIGSTAVKGLRAKPIIDIAIELYEFYDAEKCVPFLKEIGYTDKGTDILPERRYFSKGGPRTHQIHMYPSGNKYLLEQIKFRDYLRDHEQIRAEYEALKIHLSTIHKQNKHLYTEQKTDFIQSVLARLDIE